MTVAVRIAVEPTEHASARLVEVQGKKKTTLFDFTKDNKEWTGHVWDGRTLAIEEVDLGSGE